MHSVALRKLHQMVCLDQELLMEPNCLIFTKYCLAEMFINPPPLPHTHAHTYVQVTVLLSYPTALCSVVGALSF